METREDALSRLCRAASGLLGVVDQTLARHGAPQGHPIWPLLRAVGLLPGDAAVAVEALPVQALWERARLLAAHGERAAALVQQVRSASGWEGTAAQAANVQLAAIGGGLESLVHNASELGAAWARVADLAAEGRMAVAGALARVLKSAQAVELTVGDGGPADWARAAADIGVEVLAEVDRLWADALGVARAALAGFDDGTAGSVKAAPAEGGDGFAVEL